MAINIHLTDAEHAGRVRDVIIGRLGQTIVRAGTTGVSLHYRCSTGEPVLRMRAARVPGGGWVDVLSEGHLVEAFGIDPDTGDGHVWAVNGSPMTIPFAELPEVTNRDVWALAHEIEALLRPTSTKRRGAR